MMAATKKTAVRTKTTTTKKTSAKKKTRRTAIKARSARLKTPPLEEPLTKDEIEHFRQMLLDKRRELIGDVDRMREEALESNRQESSGDLSNMPIHMADIGTDNYEQEFTLSLIESERKALRDIDRALNKIQEGTYGICEGTGKVMNRARLEARPEARYCIEYARLIEQGLVKPEGKKENTD